jgi:uncharacterized protein
VIRRLTVSWPVGQRAPHVDGRRVRLLAVSDEHDPALEIEQNRQALGPIDAVLGCGDLDPDYLAFLGDAFGVPLLYVRGNHDRGAAWAGAGSLIPQPIDGTVEVPAGIPTIGLSWPGNPRGPALRYEMAAWSQAIRAAANAFFSRSRPRIVVSHVPPRGLGDAPGDAYHTGFAAYRWLCRRLRPVLWLHGHTAPASVRGREAEWNGTTMINVTGAVLIEIEGATA